LAEPHNARLFSGETYEEEGFDGPGCQLKNRVNILPASPSAHILTSTTPSLFTPLAVDIYFLALIIPPFLVPSGHACFAGAPFH